LEINQAYSNSMKINNKYLNFRAFSRQLSKNLYGMPARARALKIGANKLKVALS
jgi:hypothetical protein